MSEPKRYTVVDVEKHTITEVVDVRGCQEIPPRPLRLECDFCGTHVDRLWCRPVRAVCMWLVTGGVRRSMDYDGGHWCACVFCNPLVELKDLRSLVARVTIVNFDGAGVSADFRTYLERMYSTVFAATSGPAVEWHSGDKWPVG